MAAHQAPPSLGFSRQETGVGCHFLLQCIQVKSQSEATQSCPTLSDPMDCSLPCSSVHGIFQARVLEWGAIAFSAWCMWLSTNPWRHSGYYRPQAGTWVHDLGFSPPISLPPLVCVSRITFNPPSSCPLFLLWPRVGDPVPSLLRWIQYRFIL